MQVKISLHACERGLYDYDVAGLPHVHRVCVPDTIKRGDTFNVYCSDGVKLGATWKGSVERSLATFAATHPSYLALAS